ncbi:hypothetical protein BDV38DRAFT_279048 [Aspergillus pseudotamarii]|uniref:Uncharacterized protein n=1 Tax=Aspergillus pseudotamarii TaxID=132259 RepID=A0A5N6T630_ASPPS|nr:uncharacterized protein BDV38DRAFT_279048 [Aspergillus pseudotamarii]KAE8141699.1 hypothetical protein BDV38DRAFT_279048 [Aspergillus pseudotamarii]
MTTAPEFLIRDAGIVKDDDQFVVVPFDAAIPYLTSIGSHEQWGRTPFSHRKRWGGGTTQHRKDSKSSALQNYEKKNSVLRISIVENECNADGPKCFNPRLAHYRVLSDRRRYLCEHLQIPESNERATSISKSWLQIVESLFIAPGSGKCGRKKQKEAFWLDGWAGNDTKLIRDYAHQGFRLAGDFSLPRANQAETLMRMEI